jgi:tetratricopeptide (TPR) repeat protein
MAYNNRGLAKYQLVDYRGAVADYTKAIKIDPNYAATYTNRGAAKAKLGDYRGAIADYNKTIEFVPNDAMAYYNRGAAKVKLGDKNGACLDLSKAGELGDGDAYDMIKKFHDEVYEIGYTFDSGLDAEPYGLRPIGIELNQLEGWEDM